MYSFCKFEVAECILQAKFSPGDEIIDDLAENAGWLFSMRLVSQKQIDEYVREITLIEDWNEQCTKLVYSKYLQKISFTAEKLAQNLFE